MNLAPRRTYWVLLGLAAAAAVVASNLEPLDASESAAALAIDDVCNGNASDSCAVEMLHLRAKLIQQATATDSTATSEDVEKHLKTIDAFLDKQPRQTYLPGGVGLLQTFGPNSISGGDCGKEFCELPEPCPFGASGHCRFDVYDNAVAAIYYIKRGKLKEARRILDAFLHLLYPPKKVPHLSFGNPQDHLPSGHWLTLCGASYWDGSVEAGTYSGGSLADGAVDTGNNAWVGMAFVHYAAAADNSCFAVVARDILQALKKGNHCEDKLQGFKARLRPYPGEYRSSEHNIDIFAFARMLGDDKVEARAGKFIESMYNYDSRYKDVYSIGTSGTVDCDVAINGHSPIATDAQVWSLLAGADPVKARKAASLGFVLKPAVGPKGGMLTSDKDIIGNAAGGKPLEGVKFTNWGNGAQWELTASAVMAMIRYRDTYGPDADGVDVSKHINSMRGSLLALLDRYGAVPASVLGGNYAAYKKNNHSSPYPGGTDTGMDWTYFRYPHLTATAWTGLSLLYQGDDKQAVNHDANPYGIPTKPVSPSNADTKCIPRAGDILSSVYNPCEIDCPMNGQSASCKDRITYAKQHLFSGADACEQAVKLITSQCPSCPQCTAAAASCAAAPALGTSYNPMDR